jgi:O-antigen ligase
MGRRIFVTAGKLILIVVTLGLCLFWGHWALSSGNFIGVFLREVQAVLRDPGIQWMACLCLGIYFIIFSLLRRRKTGWNFWNAGNSSLWLTGTILIGALAYTFEYPASAQSTGFLTLLAGATLGQGLALCSEGNAYKKRNWIYLITVTLLLLLSLGSLEHTNVGSVQYQYWGQSRWVGAWNNPNIYGLLMGVGTILAAGLIVSGENDGEIRTWKLRNEKYLKWIFAVLCLFAAILMGRGLLHSYSRGAWLAAICGLGYLFWSSVQSPKSKVQGHWIYWLKKNWLPFSVILASAFALSFWQFRQTEAIIAKRALSVGNVNDFSWRNRISTWEGAFQIMAEHPWLGAGWNKPEALYDPYYLLPKMEESGAIGLNDYLMLGATLGVPALICFGMYIWLSLRQNSEARSQKPEAGDRQDACSTLDIGHWTLDRLQTVCRAGAIVLLVGFWFDGGLFNLPTAATFWILLELGAVELHKGTAKQTNEVF